MILIKNSARPYIRTMLNFISIN